MPQYGTAEGGGSGGTSQELPEDPAAQTCTLWPSSTISRGMECNGRPLKCKRCLQSGPSRGDSWSAKHDRPPCRNGPMPPGTWQAVPLSRSDSPHNTIICGSFACFGELVMRSQWNQNIFSCKCSPSGRLSFLKHLPSPSKES